MAVLLWRKSLLRGGERLDSLVSKEGAFILTNLTLMSFLVVVFMGTIFPTLSEFLTATNFDPGAIFQPGRGSIHRGRCSSCGLCPVIGWQRSPVRIMARNAGIFALLTVTFALIAYAAGGRVWIASLLFGLCAAMSGAYWQISGGRC